MLQLLKLGKTILALKTAAMEQLVLWALSLMIWLIASTHRVIITDTGQVA